MPLNYSNVQAQVVDIREDTPTRDEKFLVDSNVWLWFTYRTITLPNIPDKVKPKFYQISKYPHYLGIASGAGAKLFYCGLSLTELAHNIEKIEKELYLSRRNLENLELKEYRHNHSQQRRQVFREIQNVWLQITRVSDCINIEIKAETVQKTLASFETNFLDGYDLFMVEAMKSAGVNQIITDDGDYLTVPNITIFTANGLVIDTARKYGKLLSGRDK